MDTELTYKYKDGFHKDIKIGHITLDKGVFKSFAGRYDCNFEDSPINSLARRLWNCKLVWEGDVNCKWFLDSLKEFWTKSNKGFVDSYDDKFSKLHEWLKAQELVEIIFECY